MLRELIVSCVGDADTLLLLWMFYSWVLTSVPILVKIDEEMRVPCYML